MPSITLKEEMAEKLDAIAERNQRSRAGQVRHWINQNYNPNNFMETDQK